LLLDVCPPEVVSSPSGFREAMKTFVRLLTLAIYAIALSPIVHAAPPDETRDWKSTAGTTINARVTSFAGGVATLETSAGRVVQVPLSKLSLEDQGYLEKHFASAADGQESGPPPADLPHPLGEAVGPIEASRGNYVLYLPKSLKDGHKAPLLFFTHSGGGDKGKLGRLMEGAEICGWIVAMSVESKNGATDYFPEVEACVEHILETLPVDPKRIYFSGTSGGARVAFSNSTKIPSAGVLAFIAGAQPGEISRKKHYFFINGATDYNRAGSAFSFAEAKSNAAMRFHPGTHADGPEWLVTEGIVWLECQWHEKSKADPAAQADFAKAALDWVEKTKATDPLRAGWWAARLSEMRLPASEQSRAAGLKKELAASPEAIAYAGGLADLEKFALDVLTETPRFSPDCFEFTSGEVEKKVDKLLKTYGTTPWIKDILEALKQKTGRS
jgi:hypothetical protein